MFFKNTQFQIRNHKMNFDGRSILITGGSSGIGADAARHLAGLGAQVAIVGRHEGRLDEVVEQIKNLGAPTPLKIVADITKDAERIVNETINHFGKIDVLVNNGGFAIFDTLPGIKLFEFDRVFDTNVRSIITLTKLCIPHLEATKGNIVNVSSTAGIYPIPHLTSYCISKAALNQFTKCAAFDLAPKGIRVNSINPALIRTPFRDHILTPDQNEKVLEEVKGKYPLRRAGDVKDTSAAIAYLADNQTSSFITGTLLTVDGGAIASGIA